MGGQRKKMDAYANFTHNLHLPDSGSVCKKQEKNTLLTCLGILCRRIDEVQNTWRQCHGKDCPVLWASWAERAEEKGRN